MADFSISRSTHIDADPTVVHSLVNDFREWPKWSPWERLDPALRRTYSGPATGAGAHYAWEGNSKAGAGTMEMVRSDPSRIEIALEFLKPFKASNTTTFAFTSSRGGTDITWTMSGRRGAVMSAMGGLFFDKRIGKDFEQGLAGLKSCAESS